MPEMCSKVGKKTQKSDYVKIYEPSYLKLLAGYSLDIIDVDYVMF